MKKRIFRWIVLILVAGGAVLIVRYYTKPDPIEVAVKPVSRGLVERSVANTRAGTVKACRRARLSPALGGQIAKLPVKEGEPVKAGQLLLELWNKDLIAQAVLADREVETAGAQAQSVCLQAGVADRESARLNKLFKTGAASEDQTDRAVTRAASLRADCKAARASMAMSRAKVALARANLDRTRLTAPFDGVVAEIHGELNEFVTPSPVGVATLPTIDLIESDCYYVTAPIDEVDAANIRVGMTARITLDAFGDRNFPGTVRRIATYVLDLEKQARTVDIEVSFANPSDMPTLLAGYSADVEVVLETRADVFRVPTESVLEGPRVFVFDVRTGMLAERKLKVGISNWTYTEIISGLHDGESVVTTVDRPGLADGVAAVTMKEGT